MSDVVDQEALLQLLQAWGYTAQKLPGAQHAGLSAHAAVPLEHFASDPLRHLHTVRELNRRIRAAYGDSWHCMLTWLPGGAAYALLCHADVPHSERP